MKFLEFFQNQSWKKWEKSQWTILVLSGVLLMILAIPSENKKREEELPVIEETESAPKMAQKDYAEEMERRLENALKSIEGAGRVEVMITIEDLGESIVEKDTVLETSDLQESGQEGGSRAQKNGQTARSSVYQETGSDKIPFVGKEKTPKISGVLVVCEGGENTTVKQNISEAVMALFQIDVNRIKVVKMNIQEEEY